VRTSALASYHFTAGLATNPRPAAAFDNLALLSDHGWDRLPRAATRMIEESLCPFC